MYSDKWTEWRRETEKNWRELKSERKKKIVWFSPNIFTIQAKLLGDWKLTIETQLSMDIKIA